MDTQNDGPWKWWFLVNIMAIFGIHVSFLGSTPGFKMIQFDGSAGWTPTDPLDEVMVQEATGDQMKEASGWSRENFNPWDVTHDLSMGITTYFHNSDLFTLPETNSLPPLKMDGWKMNFLLEWSIFRGGTVSFRDLFSCLKNHRTLRKRGVERFGCVLNAGIDPDISKPSCLEIWGFSGWWFFFLRIPWVEWDSSPSSSPPFGRLGGALKYFLFSPLLTWGKWSNLTYASFSNWVGSTTT